MSEWVSQLSFLVDCNDEIPFHLVEREVQALCSNVGTVECFEAATERLFVSSIRRNEADSIVERLFEAINTIKNRHPYDVANCYSSYARYLWRHKNNVKAEKVIRDGITELYQLSTQEALVEIEELKLVLHELES